MKAFFKNWLEFLNHDFKLSRHQVFFAVVALLIIGLGLRCGYWAMRDRPPRDEKFYIQAVENINKKDSTSFEKHEYYIQLMPWIASALCRFGISAETALRSLNLFYATLWVLIMFFLCRDVFGDSNVGLLGLAFAAFNPYSVRMASQILREPLYILLFTLSLWCAVRIIRSKGVNMFYPASLGVLSVLSVHTRIEGFEIMLFLPLAVIVLFVQYRKNILKRCIYSCIVYVFSLTVLTMGIMFTHSGSDYILGINKKTVGYYNTFTTERIKNKQ